MRRPPLAVPCVALLLLGCGEATPPEPGPGGGGAGGGGGNDGVPACEDGKLWNGSACAAFGVPDDACPPGFEWAAGGCRAVLPDAPCQGASFALAGDTTCRPLRACEGGPWGDAEASAQVFVDASATGAEVGTSGAPFHTLAAALAAANDGDVIALAAGSYERVPLGGKSVTLWGRCPGEVRLTASTTATPMVQGETLTLRDLTVDAQTDATHSGGAVSVLAGTMVAERVHFTGGIRHIRTETGAGRATVDVSESIFEGAEHGALIGTNDAVFRVEDSVLRRNGGATVSLPCAVTMITGASLEMRRSVLRSNEGLGVCGINGPIDVEASVIRDTTGALPYGGVGLYGLGGTTAMRASEIAGSAIVGVYLESGEGVFEHLTIRGAASEPGRGIQLGTGIHATATPTLSLRDSLLADLGHSAVTAFVSSFEIEGALIRDVTPEDGLFGDGVVAVGPHEATQANAVTRSAIVDPARAGLTSFGTAMTVKDVRLDCAAIGFGSEPFSFDPDDPEMTTYDASFEDAGGNLCSCAGEVTVCKALSSDVTVPEPLPSPTGS